MSLHCRVDDPATSLRALIKPKQLTYSCPTEVDSHKLLMVGVFALVHFDNGIIIWHQVVILFCLLLNTALVHEPLPQSLINHLTYHSWIKIYLDKYKPSKKLFTHSNSIRRVCNTEMKPSLTHARSANPDKKKLPCTDGVKPAWSPNRCYYTTIITLITIPSWL